MTRVWLVVFALVLMTGVAQSHEHGKPLHGMAPRRHEMIKSHHIPVFRRVKPEYLPLGWIQFGPASYYGIGDGSGRRTASGAHFDPRALTAAHAWLPFGTRVRVTVVGTGENRMITINDRTGPAVARGGRVLDLSDGAARALGFHRQGVARVKMEVIPKST